MGPQIERRLRRDQPLRAAREQWHAQRRFQLAHMTAEAWLGHAEHPSRAGKAALTQHGEEGAVVFPRGLMAGHTKTYSTSTYLCNFRLSDHPPDFACPFGDMHEHEIPNRTGPWRHGWRRRRN